MAVAPLTSATQQLLDEQQGRNSILMRELIFLSSLRNIPAWQSGGRECFLFDLIDTDTLLIIRIVHYTLCIMRKNNGIIGGWQSSRA